MLAFESLVMILVLIAVASQQVSFRLLNRLSKEIYMEIFPRGMLDANRSTHFKAAKFLYYPKGWKEINSSKLRLWLWWNLLINSLTLVLMIAGAIFK